MDSETIKSLAEFISKQTVFDWKYYLSIIVLSFTGAAVGAFVSSYFKIRGKNLATKADFNELLQQLAKTTEATEKIKTAIAHANWKGEKQWDLNATVYQTLLESFAMWRSALEELEQLAFDKDGNLRIDKEDAKMFFEKATAAKYNIRKSSALAGMVLDSEQSEKISQLFDAVHNIKHNSVIQKGVYKDISNNMKRIESEIAAQAKKDLLGID